MSIILLIGGAGYIGSHLNKKLASKGYEILVLDNLSRGHRKFAKWGNFIEGDLKDINELRRIMRVYPICAVIHLAAFAYVGESMYDPQCYYQNNVANTLKLLQVMQEFKVNYIIFSSSCAVYGLPESLPIKENHPLNPINPYGRTKSMIENILSDYARAYGMKYISLRYFNAAGADPEKEIGEWHEPEPHLIPSVLEVALGTRDYVSIYGINHDTPDGTCIRDYIHVCDLANAHIQALEFLFNGGSNVVINLGNQRGFSVKEVLESAKDITQTEIHHEISDKRPGDPPVLTGSNEKAYQILGWRPYYNDLKDIIITAWNWRKQFID